jgi:hypothetical protein
MTTVPRTNYTPNTEPAGGRLTNKFYGIDAVELAAAIIELQAGTAPSGTLDGGTPSSSTVDVLDGGTP